MTSSPESSPPRLVPEKRPNPTSSPSDLNQAKKAKPDSTDLGYSDELLAGLYLTPEDRNLPPDEFWDKSMHNFAKGMAATYLQMSSNAATYLLELQLLLAPSTRVAATKHSFNVCVFINGCFLHLQRLLQSTFNKGCNTWFGISNTFFGCKAMKEECPPCPELIPKLPDDLPPGYAYGSVVPGSGVNSYVFKMICLFCGRAHLEKDCQYKDTPEAEEYARRNLPFLDEMFGDLRKPKTK